MGKIAYVQMEVVAGNPKINAKKMLNYIEQAKKQDAWLIIFPQFAFSGMFSGNAELNIDFVNDCKSYEDEIVAASDEITIIFGNIRFSESGEPLNKYFVVSNGEIGMEGDGKEIILLNTPTKGKNYKTGIKIDCYPFAIGQKAEREFGYSQGISGAFKRPLIYVNCVGIQNRGKSIYPFDGLSTVYNSRGEIVQQFAPFEEGMKVIEELEIENMPPLEISEPEEVEEIFQAVEYGTRKFLEQIGMKKVVIGISGGIDSAVAAALYTKILGAENVFLVNMPSIFNSETTKNLSEQLAKNLGCKYCVIPIQESVDHTVRQLETTPIKFLSDDSEEFLKISSSVKENIQARDRGSRILAAMSAVVGGGFTCNANKAEGTIGYATMYGDCAGFLSAQGDLWKFQVYAIANYFNEKIYQREVIPQGIIDIVPSAELSDAQNVDEGKGDPLHYDYHDYLFRAFTEKNLTPTQILEFYAENILEEKIGCKTGLVEKYFPTAKEFIEDLERWWKLYTGFAVAKRIQSPPVLALSMNHIENSLYEPQNKPYFTKKYYELKKKYYVD